MWACRRVGVTLSAWGGGNPERAPVGVVRIRSRAGFLSVWLFLVWRAHDLGCWGSPGALPAHKGVEVGKARQLAE